MTDANPVPPLSPGERALIAKLEAEGRDAVMARLKSDLQTAIQIELATIPIYLYTYYSILRVKDTANTGGQDDAFMFGNTAAANIMSVAVEEMLHMSLSSNILFSLGTMPILYKRAPSPYPTPLPNHNPVGPPGPDGDTAVKIPLAKLTYEQLWHFLQIEYPQQAGALPQDSNWDTIGQYYDYIRCLIQTNVLTDADFTVGAGDSQIQPFNYSPNNVDTVSPSKPFDPWKHADGSAPPQDNSTLPSAAQVAEFPNSPDRHSGENELITVACKNDALDAITTISDQGEGNPTATGTAAVDDPSKSEFSHYYKFLTIQAQLTPTGGHREVPAPTPVPPVFSKTWSDGDLAGAGVVYNFPDNPVTAKYPAELQPLSDFLNGLFQYMLIMTETIYLVEPGSQKLFFNEGLHRSMIWVMDKFIQVMRKIEITSGSYQGHVLAPTFENYDLGERQNAFARLRALGEKAISASASESYGSDVAYYVGIAISDAQDGHPMHLPDVSKYWS